MKLHDVTVAAVGDLVVRVQAVGTPQSISGGVFRFDAAGQQSDLVGPFRTRQPDVPLGAPGLNRSRVILIAGEVLPMNDPIPVPYSILITVLQGSTAVYESVPEIGGSGTIQKDAVSFAHLLRILVV
jgi:hypothetical protein